MSESKDNTNTIKYPKPHILLMNVENSISKHLENAGFDVDSGFFGIPYNSPAGRDDSVYANYYFPPHLAEKEIVVIDLSTNIWKTRLGKPIGHFIDNETGVIDPRPLLMERSRSNFDRISSYGGVFIIFADSKTNISWYEMDKFHTYDPLNNWAFLSQFQEFNFIARADQGKEIKVEPEVSDNFKTLLNKYLTDAQYLCTIGWRKDSDLWQPLAKNKYGGVVSAAVVQDSDEARTGCSFIFPHMNNKAEFLEEFISQYLPSLFPHLFPFMEGSKWIQRKEYILNPIQSMYDSIEAIQQNADKQILALRQQIEQKESETQFINNLLTATDDVLVDAVEKSLEILGFKDIVKMDKEREKNGANEPKREDLQIRDVLPTLLVEVKGISGHPTDKAALQVSKYIAPRMKSLGHTNVRGLAVINHQRHIPALDREKNPFSEDILESALHSDFGLLTTWNLYRLVRSYLSLGWKYEQIASLFYQNGYVEPIPAHYEYVGFIEHYWGKVSAIGIRIEANTLNSGDTIAFEFPIEFEEQKVTSLQCEKEKVSSVAVGQLAGVASAIDGDKLKKNTKVYRIKNSH
jgi:hypothetical protein